MNVNLEHLAIIMDGNGRWAQANGLPRSAGHRAGLDALREVLRCCERYQIPNLTIFAFSSENWRRPKSEVRLLMDLFLSTLKKELNELRKQNIRLKFIGDTLGFEPRLRQRIQEAEVITAANTGMQFNIAANYGGRWDIVQAAKSLAREVKAGRLLPENIDEHNLGRYLCLSELPEPDLLIRTGGESRISNFLSWQLAYTELYFTECLWPDFDAAAFAHAMTWYTGRQRRFGRTPEQASLTADNIQHA